MTTMSLIRAHIHRMKPGELFTSRDLLNYGTRSAIDTAVYLFVRSKRIVRLARGVFVREHDMHKRTITVKDIASTKAAAFAKHILDDASDVARRLNISRQVNAPANLVSTFATSGCSSSLRSVRGIIRFRTAAQRKIVLGNDLQGDSLRALWSIGKWQCKEDEVSVATLAWNRLHRDNLRVIGKYLPQWLHKQFYRSLKIYDKKQKASRKRPPLSPGDLLF